MRTNLGADDVADLLVRPLNAVIATRRKDDTVMLSPVWFEWDDGGLSIWAHSEEDGKVVHLLRDPRVSVVVQNSDWPYKGLEIRGSATVSSDAERFFGLLRRTAERYLGPEAADRMVRDYEGKPGVVIRVEPGTLRAWDFTDDA